VSASYRDPLGATFSAGFASRKVFKIHLNQIVKSFFAAPLAIFNEFFSAGTSNDDGAVTDFLPINPFSYKQSV
jgi:hypothetical protein